MLLENVTYTVLKCTSQNYMMELLFIINFWRNIDRGKGRTYLNKS